MEEDESDAYILPLIIPRNKKSSGASSNSVQQNNNLNHAQTTMTTTTSISSGGDSEGEDANHNHLPLPTSTTTTGRVLDSVQVGETGSFTLQVTFQPGNKSHMVPFVIFILTIVMAFLTYQGRISQRKRQGSQILQPRKTV